MNRRTLKRRYGNHDLGFHNNWLIQASLRLHDQSISLYLSVYILYVYFYNSFPLMVFTWYSVKTLILTPAIS